MKILHPAEHAKSEQIANDVARQLDKVWQAMSC